MVNIFFIGLGGTIGAILRYFISKKVQLYFNQLFPLGTLVVNIIGAFFIGFLYSFFEDIIVSREIRSFLTIGLLGGFTTFSTYSLETINLLREGEVGLGIFNIFLNNGLSFFMVIFGIISARLCIKLAK